MMKENVIDLVIMLVIMTIVLLTYDIIEKNDKIKELEQQVNQMQFEKEYTEYVLNAAKSEGIN